MGIQKWMLKNGLGSPGSAAKFFSDYHRRLVSTQPGATWEDIFQIMYYDRVKTMLEIDPKNKAGGRLTIRPLEAIVVRSEGDICLFTFIVLYLQTNKFRRGIDEAVQNTKFNLNTLTMVENEFDLCLEVIQETIQTNTPQLIKFDKQILKRKALEFMTDF